MTSPYTPPEHRSDIPVASTEAYKLWSMAFWSFLLTQFLGAFNDNYFKQMVLLTCLSRAASNAAGKAPDRQSLALAAFALPFIFLSGLGGYLSDRCAKSRVIVGCKIAEVGIMGLGLMVLFFEGLSDDAQLLGLIGVLSCMGAHSAIFAPSKYGVLPELFHKSELRPVNGAIQMTTFLAIIFGTAIAGIALDQMGRSLWIGSLIAMGIASFGTLTSLFIPRTIPAEPTLVWKRENVFLPKSIRELLRRDTALLTAILISAIFWFLGGATQVAVNAIGKTTFHLSDTRTSLMVACIGFGIMAGCIIAGFLGQGGSGRHWVTLGAWMLFASLVLIAALGSGVAGMPANAGQTDGSIVQSLLHADGLEWGLRASMVLLGISAGMFVVPLQVFLQQAPPPEFKGRLLGVQNLATWIGILLSAFFTAVSGLVLKRVFGAEGDATYQWLLFVAMAVMLLPVCIFYRLPRTETKAQAEA